MTRAWLGGRSLRASGAASLTVSCFLARGRRMGLTVASRGVIRGSVGVLILDSIYSLNTNIGSQFSGELHEHSLKSVEHNSSPM